MGSPPGGRKSIETESSEFARPGHDVEAPSASTAHDKNRHRAFDGLLGEREVDLMSATDGNRDLTGLVATANPGHHMTQLPDFIGHRRSPVDPSRTVLPPSAPCVSHERFPRLSGVTVPVRRRSGVRPAWYGEIAVVLFLLVAYDRIADIARVHATAAQHRGRSLLDAERVL